MKRILLTLLIICSLYLSAPAQGYWNSLQTYRLNKIQPHSCVIPDGSEWRRSLNGTWRFRYVDSPSQVKTAWTSADASLAAWDTIRVPGNIELQGFGTPVYVNMRNEFPSNPPFAPTAYNPVGVYARDFSLPAHWQNRRTIVKFGAVKAAMYLYVNGREAGYSEDSKTPAEWDITKYLRPGTNRIVAKVLRWCDGSYLECQDMWRMSGITRDVELYSVPWTYISDIKIIADLDTADFRTGLLDVMVDLNREVNGGRVELLTSVDSTVLTHRFSRADWFASFQHRFGEVEGWTDSTPVLYTLTAVLYDAAGRETQRVTRRFGFRHIDIRNGLLRINGRPIEIRGVNRHEHSASGGHYISPDEMRRDISLMKELGINAVRTSHYPDDELWYDLCDSAGIYLWDEANVESHAQGYGEHSLAKKKEWLNPILDRIYNMYRRDRNHPSVIVWSLGNECGNGFCFEEAYRFLKGKDNTRPVAYERALTDWNTDIVCIMYPSVDYLSQYARNPRNQRPFIITEYCHAMGNSMGGLQDYWDTIDKYPQLQGGFIWDWADQSFPMPGGWWAAGGDLGALPGIADDDNFCANGVVAADRSLHPHAYEVQAVYTRGRHNIVTPAPPSAYAPSPLPCNLQYSESHGVLTIGNDDFALTVSLADGSITSYTFHGTPLLASPLKWHFWRPPTDNDLADPRGARAWQDLDRLGAELLGWTVLRLSDERCFELHTLYRLSTPDGAALRLKQLLEVNSAGQLQLSCQVVPGGQFSTLPMLGLQFGLDTAAFSACTFRGNIHETYPDRRAAQRVSTWYKSLSELSAPQYVNPQEQGRREASWVRFGGTGAELSVVSPAAQGPMGFSVRRWNDSTLAAVRRWRDVGEPDEYYTVTIDYRTAGLGTATCGPGVADRFLISGDSSYTYRFLFDPTGDACEAEPFRLHPDLQRQLPDDEQQALAVRSIESSRDPSPPYAAAFPAALTDGRRAVAGDYRHGWVGFQGTDTLVLTLTLDAFTTLGRINVGSCHSPADWVVKPLDVQASWSIDGHRWSEWTSMELRNAPADLYRDSRRLRYSLQPRRARSVSFVRLRFISRPSLPIWHPCAGQKGWLMIDEIELIPKR